MFNSESRAMTDKEIERLKKPSKRVRKYFPNAMLAHVWANESQNEGFSSSISRNGKRTMFFRGDSIYSYGYHYLAAKIFTRDDGTKYALINSTRYSTSTDGHMRDIRAALNGKMPYIEVPDCSQPDSGENEEYFNNRIVEYVQTVFETRKKYYNNIPYIKDQVSRFNITLKSLGIPDIAVTRDQWDDLLFLQNERDAFNNCPIKNAKRDKARLKTKIELEFKYQKQIEYYRSFDYGDVDNAISKFRSFESDVIEQNSIEYRDANYLDYNTIERLKKYGIELKKGDEFNIDYDFLRVDREKKIVETSNRAEVPLSHAIRLLKMILKGDAIQGERVGLFTLDHVLDDPKGDKTVKIGCHKILLSEAINVLKPYMLEIAKWFT